MSLFDVELFLRQQTSEYLRATVKDLEKLRLAQFLEKSFDGRLGTPIVQTCHDCFVVEAPVALGDLAEGYADRLVPAFTVSEAKLTWEALKRWEELDEPLDIGTKRP